ncbi:MAG: hypothetical protein HZB99_03905 [Candidatus Harrisonbacteria bacterium]|nr:hypothetical protein [Candidatus Harrisonbacteria bacterium]
MKRTVTLALLIVAFYFTGYYLIGIGFVPDNFTEARRQGALIAKDIVKSAEESLARLSEISEADRRNRFNKALELVRAELDQAQESRKKAISLTAELDKMARSAAGIKPVKARNVVMEAVGHEVSLITHLIVYNDVLNSLLQTLVLKFSGDLKDNTSVQALIETMNGETKEINKLNDLYNQKMKLFDDLVRNSS